MFLYMTALHGPQATRLLMPLGTSQLEVIQLPT